MPNNKISHKDNRALVCLICFSKGSGMTEVKEGTVTLNRIYKFFLKLFNLSNQHFPNGICTKCRKVLERPEKGDKNIILSKPFMEINKFKNTCGLSNRQGAKVLSTFSSWKGRDLFEINVRDKLS